MENLDCIFWSSQIFQADLGFSSNRSGPIYILFEIMPKTTIK